ncbi:MAG: hypothetical protein ACTS5I_00895 [Rhodanobacter sp.]
MSDLLSDGALAQARALQAKTFDLVATITRLVEVDDGAGGTLPGTPVTTTSPCRVSGHKSAIGEQIVGGAMQGAGLWDITFPALTDIRLEDRITVVFSPTNTRNYEVVNAYAPKSRETARVVLAVER